MFANDDQADGNVSKGTQGVRNRIEHTYKGARKYYMALSIIEPAIVQLSLCRFFRPLPPPFPRETIAFQRAAVRCLFCLFVPLPLLADFIKPVPEGEMTLVHFSNYDRSREDNE